MVNFYIDQRKGNFEDREIGACWLHSIQTKTLRKRIFASACTTRLATRSNDLVFAVRLKRSNKKKIELPKIALTFSPHPSLGKKVIALTWLVYLDIRVSFDIINVQTNILISYIHPSPPPSLFASIFRATKYPLITKKNSETLWIENKKRCNF